ncbi:hypothetical protein [Gulosibacter bifidus]|uniref:Uncharacterized protein n=1 Tax=Gulosibacter bifidus TaxID=272239 RepID=A0ABW5RH86_9MICO|nr:hypothetical protein [Gulosibacter bifidus]
MTEHTETTRNLGKAVGIAALLTLCATMFATNERDITMVLPAWDTFMRAFGIALVPTVIYAAVMYLIGSLWRLDAAWKAAIAALAGALVGHGLGYIFQILSNGAELNETAWQLILTEPLGLSFPFVISAVVIAAIVVPLVLRDRDETETDARSMRRPAPIAAVGSAFMRVPSDEFLSSLDDETQDRANEQWEAVVAMLEEHEWGTQAIGGAEQEHDSLYLADTALVLGEQVIMAQPAKSDERRLFTEVRRDLEGAGAIFDELEAPAEFDPMDVVQADGALYVGVGARTNAAALRGLRRLVTARGYRVIAVPVAGGMRLAEAMSVLPDGTKLVWAEAVQTPSVLGGFIAVPEPRGAAAIALDAQTIAMSASATQTAELVRALGYRVELLELDALEAKGVTLPRMLLLSR